MADDARQNRKNEDPHSHHHPPQDHDVVAVDPPPSALHAAVQLGDLMRLETNRQLRAAAARSVASSSGGSTVANPSPPPPPPPPHGPPAWWATPGLVDGLVAGTLVAALLTPVRGQILSRVTAGPAATLAGVGNGPGGTASSASSSPFRLFADFVVTSLQTVLSASAGLYVGSLQGSRTYLQQLSRTPPPAAHGKPGLSPEAVAADAVCQSDLVTQWLAAPPALWPPPPLSSTRSANEDRPAIAADQPSKQEFYFAQDPRRQTLEAFAAALEACRNRRRSASSIDPPPERPEMS